MLKQKFVFAVSLIAMVTVGIGAARADIASTKYVQEGVQSAIDAADDAQGSADAAQTSADNAQAAAEAAQASADSAAASAKTANDAIAGLDLTQVGADGSYIKTVKQADGKVTATAEAADTTPTASSKKMVTSGGVYTALSGKQDTLTTSNIKGAGSVSVGISNGVIMVTGTDNDTKYTLPAATDLTLGGVKIGSNISNSNGTISVATANGSTLGVVKAGTNVSISSGAVSVATGTPSTLGVVKVGQIPSGSATSTTYATIWVE